MDYNPLAARVAGKSPDKGTRRPRLRQAVSAGPNPADRAGTIRVTIDGTTVPGVSTLAGPIPAGQAVWLLETGGLLLVLGRHQDTTVADGSPLGVGQSTLPRTQASSSSISQTSGLLRLTYFTATRTEPVAKVRVLSGAVAAGATPTLARVGLYSVAASGDLTLAGSTPNDTALFAGTNTAYTKTLTTPSATVAGSRYALGVLVVTTATAPQLAGFSALPASELAVAPRVTGSLSGQTDLPSSIAAASVGTSGGAVYGVLLPS